MQTEPAGGRPVEEIRCDGLPYALAKRVPAVSLGDDARPERLGDETAIGLLSHLEDKLMHIENPRALLPRRERLTRHAPPGGLLRRRLRLWRRGRDRPARRSP